MATKRALIDDIILRIYQGKPSDDIELSAAQVAHWLDLELDALLKEKFEQDIANGDGIDPFYHEKEYGLSLIKETHISYDEELTEYRYYFTPAYLPLELRGDKGIIWIRDKYGKLLASTTINDSDWMRELPYGGITSRNQAWYRERDRVYVEESSQSSANVYKYDINYVRAGKGVDTALDSEYPLEEGLIPDLLDRVELIARREMMSGVSDLDNDGVDPYHE